MFLKRCQVVRQPFFKDITGSGRPLLIKGLTQEWSCTNLWCNYHQLKKRIKDSPNNVRVEVDGNYLSKNMQVMHMNLVEVLDYFIDQEQLMQPSNQSIKQHVYVAQQDLQDIPSLYHDINIPDITRLSGTNELYGIKLWLGGPTGTSSPCHYDPYSNILCQIFGIKHILLFPPTCESVLYPYYGTSQKNTSQINFDNFFDINQNYEPYDIMDNTSLSTDYCTSILKDTIKYTKKEMDEDIVIPVAVTIPSTHRLIKKYPPLLTVKDGILVTLTPGDSIYIPAKWWHYCVAPTASCSINFWWL